jgi:hypothetical protein
MVPAADVLPIAVFIYSYFLLAIRRYACFWSVRSFLRRPVAQVFFAGVNLNGSVGYLPALMVPIGWGSPVGSSVGKCRIGAYCGRLPSSPFFSASAPSTARSALR